MADMENKANGLKAISDDELEAVAGGMSKAEKKRVQEKAAADGRTFKKPAFNLLCVCNNDYKYARSKMPETGGPIGRDYNLYMDIKCYKCGKTWGHTRH